MGILGSVNVFVDIIRKFKERLGYRRLAHKHGKDLIIKQNNLKKIKKDDIILFATLRNESPRIPYFLKYYRDLGVKHFIFVDNNSTDSFQNIVSSENDISVFFTNAGYKASNFGMHWINHLLNKYGNKHWCVVCDPDEFLVYPKMEYFSLKELTQYLAQCHRESFFTLMLDMYGKARVSETLYTKGSDPLPLCPYFDKMGYFFQENYYMNSIWAQGGVRLRKHFANEPQAAPAINKIPLVRWKKGFAYISSMHQAIPRRLNNGFSTGLTGVLLHFKYFSSFVEKVQEEIVRKEHYNDSKEYTHYSQDADNAVLYHSKISTRYKGWKQLADLGLIQQEEWV